MAAMARAPGRRRLATAAAWLFAAWACAWASAAEAAARAQLQVSAQRIALDEELHVTVSCSGEFSQMTELASPGFEFRDTGRQSQVSIINGDIQRIENFTYVGTPTKAGKYTLGPIELYLGGQVVAKTAAVEVEVVGSGDAGGPALAPEQAADLRRYLGQAVFIRPVLSNPQPFVGQPVVLTFELYWSRNSQVHGVRQTAAPKYGNLDAFDLLKERPEPEAVQIQNRVYQRTITERVLLTPQVAGAVRVDGPAFRIDIGDFFESRAVKVQCVPVEIAVRALPVADQPKGFDGNAVGALQATAQLKVGNNAVDKPVAKVGERLLLQYQVSGEGNLLNLKALAPPPVDGMVVEPLPTRATDGVKQSEKGTEGQRVWQYLVSFARPGRFEIPALPFASFNPAGQAYQQTLLGPFQVTVEGQAAAPAGAPTPDPAAAGAPPSVDASGAAKPAPPAVPKGPPRPIAPELGLAASHEMPWHQGALPFGLAALPWLGLVLSAAWSWQRQRKAARLPARERAVALQEAQRNLAALPAGPEAFSRIRDIAAAYLAKHGMADALNAPESVFVQRLQARGADAEVAARLAELLQHCDFARYAPTDSRENDVRSTAAALADCLARADGPLQASPPSRAASTAALALLAVALAAAPPAAAASLEGEFAAANRAYVAGDYQAAADGYQKSLARGVESAALHYNFGNALYQTGKLGMAAAHYRQAMRFQPAEALRADIEANLAAVRTALGEQARRKHETLHVFDESPDIDVALARVAPRGWLAILGIAFGFAAVGCVRRMRGRGNRLGWQLAMGLAAAAQLACLGWLALARYVDATLVSAVVVEEDAQFSACQGVGEPMGLPEGLELRKLAEMADGRVEVRLANGRQGCMDPKALQLIR